VQKDAPKPKLVGAVVQTFRILRVLEQDGRRLGVSAIARAASVNPSTAFNILRTLAVEEAVTFDEATKTYALGPGLMKLSKGLFGQSVVAAIKPELQRFATETGCLTGIWGVSEDRMILLDRAVAERPMRLELESKQRMPLLLGAVGRAVAARMQLTDGQLRAQFRALRWDAPVGVTEYVRQVREAETLGYAVDRETLYRGIVSIGAAIAGRDGRPIYGLSASDLAGNMAENRTAELGKRLSRLGRTYSGEEG
jgi:DNA-binding IclR family transcriptional regulator